MGIYKPGRPNKYDPFGKSGNRPPEKAGEYRIRDVQGTITYVGETDNLYRRMKQHLYNGKLADEINIGGSFEFKVADGRATSKTRRMHEKEKIKQHSPCLNASVGGEGRIAKK